MYVKLLIILSLLVPTLASGALHKQLRLPPENTVIIYSCGDIGYYPPHWEGAAEKLVRLSKGFNKQIDLTITIGMDCNRETLWYEATPTANIID